MLCALSVHQNKWTLRSNRPLVAVGAAKDAVEGIAALGAPQDYLRCDGPALRLRSTSGTAVLIITAP